MIEKKRFLEILESFEKLPGVLVLGDVGVDKYTMGQVRRISPEAPVPIVEVTKEWMKLGLAANVVDNLSTLKVNSTLCSVIGEDNHANLLESLLENTGQRTWGLIRDKERVTTFKERVVTPTQQIARIDYESSKELKDKTQTRLFNRYQELLAGNKALIIEDYGKGLLGKDLLQNVIKEAKEHNVLVTVDPSRVTPAQWYSGVDLLKPNKLEAQTLVRGLGFKEIDDPQELANILMNELELEQIVITLGPQGMLIKEKGDKEGRIIPTFAFEVFDVSGAGDTAIATLTSALVAQATLPEAAWVANCASGVVVGKKGTALVDKQEMIGFYERLEKMK